MSSAGCTNGSFIHTSYTSSRVSGANNDIVEDCLALVAIQNALAAQSANNALTISHALRTWGTGSTTQQKLSSTNLTSRSRNTRSTWSGIRVGFAGTTTLRVRSLHLSGIQSSALPSEIGNLTGLITLRLETSNFTSLPTQIGQLTSLENLYLTENSLRSLPTNIGSLTNLEQIDLQDNELTSLPTQIGQLTELEQLYLQNNSLTSLPTEIGRLTKVWDFYLHDNNLTSLPAEIGNLTNLYDLRLFNNSLTSLPSQIGQLPRLRTLQLQNNNLSSLPAEIGNLRSLTEYLMLSNNNLTSIPAEIGQLTSLQSLYLDNNNLRSLPAQFGNLAALRTLQLNHNDLTSLPSQFGNLSNLTTLWLNNNKLTSLPSEFGQLSSLWELQVYGNRLTSFTPLVGLLVANGGNLENLYACPSYTDVPIPKAIFDATRGGEPILKPRKPANAYCGPAWNIVSATDTIDSPQNLKTQMRLPDDRSVFRWDAINQVWGNVALATSVVSEGEAIAYEGRGAISEETLENLNLGTADEEVTATFHNGWNILKPPAVSEAQIGSSLFASSLYDCSSVTGAIITATLNLETGTWRILMPCHPSTQRSLITNGRYSALTEITQNDILYTYFISALPIQITWNDTNNKYEPAR